MIIIENDNLISCLVRRDLSIFWAAIYIYPTLKFCARELRLNFFRVCNNIYQGQNNIKKE